MLVRIHQGDNRCLQQRYHVKAMHLSAVELSSWGNFSQHLTPALSRKSVSLITRSFATQIFLDPRKWCTHLSAQCTAVTEKH